MDHKKRAKPCPCQIEDLMGVVDIVLVSHNHFAHLGIKKTQQK
jgi:L-ascorbate metabolism protein UlaG (beta-lactamase superfamily)